MVGEPDGFCDYAANQQRALLRTAWLLTGDWQHAEDLVQTALVRVWPHWTRVCRAGDPDAYVRRTLVNTYASWWRRRWHGEQPTAPLPERTDRADPYAEVVLRDALARLLPILPRRQRAVLVLRYYEDRSEAQTAELLGCSVGTVKSQTSKALRALRSAVHTAGLVREDLR